MSQSTDRSTSQVGVGEDQFYVLKRGLITIAPSEFSGLSAQKDEVVLSFPATATSDILLNSHDVYHWAADPSGELTFEDMDEVIMKLNYNKDTGQIATALFGFDTISGASARVDVKLRIEYTAPSSSGTPWSSDETQYFYYIIYSQKPFITGETV